MSLYQIDFLAEVLYTLNEVKFMLKEKIKNKEKTIGMYVQLSDISISRTAALSGYDFVWGLIWNTATPLSRRFLHI